MTGMLALYSTETNGESNRPRVRSMTFGRFFIRTWGDR